MLTSLAVLGGTAGLAFLLSRLWRGSLVKIGGALITLGLLVWSGWGAGNEYVADSYILYYSIAAVSMLGSYTVAVVVGRQLTPLMQNGSVFKLGPHLYWSLLGVVIVGLILPLVYPDFRLGRLIFPPEVSIRDARFQHYSAGRGWTETVQTIAFGAYLVLIAKFTKRPLLLVALLFIPSYIEYCSRGYIGRIYILLPIVTALIVLWRMKPDIRPQLVAASILLAAGFLYFSYWYQQIRLGGAPAEVDFHTAAQTLFEAETSFPRLVTYIIQNEVRGDFGAYISYVVNLPNPFDPVYRAPMSISHAITAAVTGTRPDATTPVRLTGLVGEGLYLYGKQLFWLHTASLGTIVGFLTAISQSREMFAIVGAYICGVAGLILQRGGAASALPLITNQLIIYHVIWFALVAYSVAANARRREILRT